MNLQMIAQPFRGAASFCHSPHTQRKQILSPDSLIVVGTTIGIFQTSFLLFFKDFFYYFC